MYVCGTGIVTATAGWVQCCPSPPGLDSALHHWRRPPVQLGSWVNQISAPVRPVRFASFAFSRHPSHTSPPFPFHLHPTLHSRPSVLHPPPPPTSFKQSFPHSVHLQRQSAFSPNKYNYHHNHKALSLSASFSSSSSDTLYSSFIHSASPPSSIGKNPARQ